MILSHAEARCGAVPATGRPQPVKAVTAETAMAASESRVAARLSLAGGPKRWSTSENLQRCRAWVVADSRVGHVGRRRDSLLVWAVSGS
jgi:hypothetical protein